MQTSSMSATSACNEQLLQSSSSCDSQALKVQQSKRASEPRDWPPSTGATGSVTCFHQPSWRFFCRRFTQSKRVTQLQSVLEQASKPYRREALTSLCESLSVKGASRFFSPTRHLRRGIAFASVEKTSCKRSSQEEAHDTTNKSHKLTPWFLYIYIPRVLGPCLVRHTPHFFRQALVGSEACMSYRLFALGR